LSTKNCDFITLFEVFLLETVGRRLKYILKHLNLTQQEVADRFGIDRSLLSFICNDKQKISKLMLYALKSEFGLNPTWLLTGEGDMFLPGKGLDTAMGAAQELSDTNLEVIDGQSAEHPELDILPKVAHTAWWQSLSETEREIIVFITHLKDPETKKKLRDLVEIALKKEISEEEFKKQIEGMNDPHFRQKGAAG